DRPHDRGRVERAAVGQVHRLALGQLRPDVADPQLRGDTTPQDRRGDARADPAHPDDPDPHAGSCRKTRAGGTLAAMKQPAHSLLLGMTTALLLFGACADDGGSNDGKTETETGDGDGDPGDGDPGDGDGEPGDGDGEPGDGDGDPGDGDGEPGDGDGEPGDGD